MKSFVILLPFLVFMESCTTTTSQISTHKAPTESNRSSLPFITKGKDENLYLSWVEETNDSSYFFFSRFDVSQDSFSEKKLIAKGKNWFVNWADYPMISVRADGSAIAHTLQKSSQDTYSYDVILTFLDQQGDIIKNTKLHRDSTLTEHGFVSYIQSESGSVNVAWLDGRKTNGKSHDHASAGSNAMTLRTTEILGDSIFASVELDSKTCDCCQTTGIMTSKGAAFIYRDRSEMEIRDIYIVRNVKDKWIEPKPVYNDGWMIAGCPVNGPRADSDQSNVAVAWYTAANEQPKVKISISYNDGESFQEPIVLDDNSPLGRVDLTFVDKERLAVSWMSNVDDIPKISWALVDLKGNIISTENLTEIKAARGSGFPQMCYHDGKLWFSWTNYHSKELKSIEICSVLI